MHKLRCRYRRILYEFRNTTEKKVEKEPYCYLTKNKKLKELLQSVRENNHTEIYSKSHCDADDHADDSYEHLDSNDDSDTVDWEHLTDFEDDIAVDSSDSDWLGLHKHFFSFSDLHRIILVPLIVLIADKLVISIG